MPIVKCASCSTEFKARQADLNRGWGKFCSKRCKARNQARVTGVNGPDYRASGKTATQMGNGNYAKSKFKNSSRAPWASAGVSRETYLEYAEEYGGTPQFNNSGEYEGFIPTPFDNSTDHQNSE